MSNTATKSSVSALGEYCAKNHIPLPTYECIDSPDGGFACRVTIVDIMAEGFGRSKRDAKHLAAANIIKKLRECKNADIESIPEPTDEGIHTNDLVMTLRDYCVQNNHPLPTFEIVQQGGTPDAPEFTVLCSLASIQRYGVSEKKKDARQKAAYEILRVIRDTEPNDYSMEVQPINTATTDVENERYKKFKTYRELTETQTGEIVGIKLADRHNYFKNFYPELKQKAFQELNDKSYDSAEDQVFAVFNALKLRPNIQTLNNSKSASDPIILIQLNCDYDVVFAGHGDNIYTNILEYFREMLI